MNKESSARAKSMSQFLRMAVMAGVESSVQLHIERGDDLNARDANGMTPLMLSAVRNKPAICRLLLSAGADPSLVDYSGKTAMSIAIATGSEAVVEALKTACSTTSAPLSTNVGVLSEPTLATTPYLLDPVSVHAPPDLPVKVVTQTGRPTPAELSESGASLHSTTDPGGLEDVEEFDLSGWEAEEEPTRPETDLAVLDSASAVQSTITAHAPIDSSIDWDDIDIYLPETALPLARLGDVEGRMQLRHLFLRALREGSVPRLDVQDQSTNEDRSANPEAEAYLAMVINDLGAELDERFEYSNADESYEVFINPMELPEEESAVDEALRAIDRAASPRHEPLQIYQREFQSQRLLTAEEEIRLAKNMEAAIEAALDALAAWSDGIIRTLAAGEQVITGSRLRSSFLTGVAEPSPERTAVESLDTVDATTDESENVTSADEEQEDGMLSEAGDTAFIDLLRQLAALFHQDETLGSAPQEIRRTLSVLRLSRRFLLELIDVARHGLDPCPAFLSAMADFQKARNQMATANLRLAFFHARKHLYSGEPLDDLAQEANIGLLTAIDHYDWRRGFRFSTYATWWIRQRISRYIADKARAIRVPVHVYEKVQRIQRVIQAFETTAGREPNLNELSKLMEMPGHKLAALLHIVPEISYIEEIPIDDVIACDARDAYSSPHPADVVNEIQLCQAVDRFISTLATEKGTDEQVLRLRFGIGVAEALTLEEIGKRMGVTRERIRQIEAKAIKGLRHPARSEPFARLALGLTHGDTSRTSVGRGAGNANGTDATKVKRMPAAQKRSTTAQASRKPSRSASPAKPFGLDRLLAQAVQLGVRVVDERLDSGHIWVEILDHRENTYRKLVRQLLDFGFTFWAGRGYWK